MHIEILCLQEDDQRRAFDLRGNVAGDAKRRRRVGTKYAVIKPLKIKA
jgi:hypothetical protein